MFMSGIWANVKNLSNDFQYFNFYRTVHFDLKNLIPKYLDKILWTGRFERPSSIAVLPIDPMWYGFISYDAYFAYGWSKL